MAQSQPQNPKSKILYLDPFSGVSGDMFVGALLDLGLDLAKLHHELSKLNVGGYQLSAKKVMRGGMSATKFDVELEKAEHVHRTFADIRAMIEASTLSSAVKSSSLAAFTKLAEAEGRIHGLPPEKVHFHEVGALDSIVDIVGACAGLELLGVDELWCGPLALGSGFVNCAHGVMPVPAPATLELMKGIPTRQSPVEKELTTPTGAALVAALAKQFCPLPEIEIEKIGYGAGAREQQAVPNVLRAVLCTAGSQDSHRQAVLTMLKGLGAMDVSVGEEEEAVLMMTDLSPQPMNTNELQDGRVSDTIVEIKTNLDDATPEVLGYLAEKLLSAGALDVFFTPIQMKKFRPGTLLTVLAEPSQFDSLAALIFKESTAFGLRYTTQPRLKLERETVTVKTEFGEVRVKIGRWQGEIVNVHPEFEDCRKLAEEKGVALRLVMEAARYAVSKSEV